MISVLVWFYEAKTQKTPLVMKAGGEYYFKIIDAHVCI